MNEKAYIKAVKDAVDRVCKGRKLPSPGARIEEILGIPLPNYPDEIMPLDLLPDTDEFKFIGWTADFRAVEARQITISGKAFWMAEDCTNLEPLVGWKPIRRKALTKRIPAQQPEHGPGNPAWEAERSRCLEQGPFFY